MKNIILFLAVLTTFAFGEIKPRVYLGMGVGSGGGEYSYSDSAGGFNIYPTDSKSTDIKLGVIDSNDNRFEISYSKTDVVVDGLLDKTLIGLDGDVILTLNFDDNENIFLPFISIGLGYCAWDGTGSNTVSGEDIMGLAFNYGAGAYISGGSFSARTARTTRQSPYSTTHRQQERKLCRLPHLMPQPWVLTALWPLSVSIVIKAYTLR